MSCRRTSLGQLLRAKGQKRQNFRQSAKRARTTCNRDKVKCFTLKLCISMRSVVHASVFLRNVNANTQQSSHTLNTLASLPSARQYDYAYNAKNSIQRKSPLTLIRIPMNSKARITPYSANFAKFPSGSSCRNAVRYIFTKKSLKNRQDLYDKKVCVQCDETEVREQKYVHTLLSEVGKRPKLVASKTVETADAKTTCRLVDSALRKFEIVPENFVHFLTDATEYMVSAGIMLKNIHQNMRDTTCLAHLMHNAAEVVRARFCDVDFLLFSVKSATVRNKTKRRQFHASGLKAPPQPVVVRWLGFVGQRWEVLCRKLRDCQGCDE